METIEASSNNGEGTRYFVDVQWYQQNGRDFNRFVVSRMCYNCQQKVGLEVEERVPVVDPKSNRVVFESRYSVYGMNPFTIFRDCCSKSKGYLTGRTALAEALFRLFLANANQPLTAEEAHQQLKEWLAFSDVPRDVSLEAVKRLLENDQFYGFKALEVPSQEEGDPNSGWSINDQR